MRSYVSHLKISKTPIGDKNEISKHISKNYIKMKKKFIYFFQDKGFGNKKGPCGKPEGKNISKGDMKKGSAKGMRKKKSLKVISGHDGHLLHPKGMADAPP